jgi:hypothetical protein
MPQQPIGLAKGHSAALGIVQFVDMGSLPMGAQPAINSRAIKKARRATAKKAVQSARETRR